MKTEYDKLCRAYNEWFQAYVRFYGKRPLTTITEER